MYNDLISIIVPVYKVEPYLRKCIDSILNQTYPNLEVILVDDGSPDNCGVICDEYAAKDSRIKVIHKINGGLSDARNAGLDMMTGQYVGFVDSDDWIEPRMYETLYMLLHQFDADIAFGGVADDLVVSGTAATLKVSNYGPTPFSESTQDALRRYFYGSWAAWDKLYRADIFRDIRYPVGEINEDEAIVVQVLSSARTVCYTNEVFYHYIHRQNSNSITASAFSEKKLAWKNHCAQNLQTIRRDYPNLVPAAGTRYRSSLMWSLAQIATLDSRSDTFSHNLLKELRDNAPLFSSIPFQSKKERFHFLLLCYLPYPLYRTLIRIRSHA